MKNINDLKLPVTKDSLPTWPINRALHRSEELTPLYIERYAGYRSAMRKTAHDYWEFTAVVRGKGTLLHDEDQKTNMTAGQILLVPPGVFHTELSRHDLDTIWVGIVGSRLDKLANKNVVWIKSEELTRRFESMWLKSMSTKSCAGPELDGMLQSIFASFLTIEEETLSSGVDSIDDAIEFMHGNFRRVITVAELATRTGSSEGHFHREFKRRTGISPMQFLTRLRLQYAMHALVRSTLSIEQVARSAGYDDALYFSRLFRKHTGKSPTGFCKNKSPVPRQY